MSKIDFFKTSQPAPKAAKPVHQDPVLPYCDGCLSEANPAWGDGSLNYCRDCAPPELKNPEQSLKDRARDNTAL